MSGSERIQPIVLVGGRSSRFGRDKLREPLGGSSEGVTWIVDVPRLVLRRVFGAPVACVGACAPEVAARFDLVIPDAYPGVGPIGGILSALEWTGGTGASVFVLAGDAVGMTEETIRRVLEGAQERPEAAAVLAKSDRCEACIGMYRSNAAVLLRARLATGSSRLFDAIPTDELSLVQVHAESCRNVNSVDDLAALRDAV